MTIYLQNKDIQVQLVKWQAGFTKLSLGIVPPNKLLPGVVQSGIHPAENCRPSGRTE